GDGEIQTNEPSREEANFEINAGASYASEDFTDLKKAFADAAALETDLFVSNVGGNGNWKVTAGNAYSGYVSGFEKVLPFLSVGIKLSNLWSEEIKGEVTGEGNAGETFSYRTSIAPSLFSIAAGVKLQTRRRPHEVALSGSLLIGPAFANATLKGNGAFMDRVHGFNSAVEYSVPMSGTGFYAELGAALEYLFSESVGLTLGCGYHYCVVGQMHSNANVDTDRDGVTDIHANEKFTHINGSDVVFDFNGLDVSGGMKIIF
ncbi:MAG: hypothetical protein HGA76_04965, partial [Candidatus Firestonebacteria bacterium]|nr:hypothetical protein [Candidatus Firestonebacteria bacterium]